MLKKSSRPSGNLLFPLPTPLILYPTVLSCLRATFRLWMSSPTSRSCAKTTVFPTFSWHRELNSATPRPPNGPQVWLWLCQSRPPRARRPILRPTMGRISMRYMKNWSSWCRRKPRGQMFDYFTFLYSFSNALLFFECFHCLVACYGCTVLWFVWLGVLISVSEGQRQKLLQSIQWWLQLW